MLFRPLPVQTLVDKWELKESPFVKIKTTEYQTLPTLYCYIEMLVVKGDYLCTIVTAKNLETQTTKKLTAKVSTFCDSFCMQDGAHNKNK